MSADQIKGRLIAVDHFDLDSHYLASFAVFDHLQVVPAIARLFLGWWAAEAAVRRHFAPGLDHRFTGRVIAISRHRRRRIGVAALLELLHQFERDLFFGLGNRASDPETSLTLDRRAAPERAAVGLFLSPPFSPLWKT